MFILERWTSDGLEKSYNLTDLDLHGPVYFDSEFGSLVVNKSGTKLAYIAEEKRPKSVPFFKKNASAKSMIISYSIKIHFLTLLSVIFRSMSTIAIFPILLFKKAVTFYYNALNTFKYT